MAIRIRELSSQRTVRLFTDQEIQLQDYIEKGKLAEFVRQAVDKALKVDKSAKLSKKAARRSG